MLKIYLVFVCSTLLSGQLCSAGRKFGYEYVPTVDGWLRLHIVPATWADARLRCHLEGGTLASPTTSALVSAMMAMMGAKGQTLTSVFTGINAVISKGDYATIEGTPLSNISLQWADGEPNNLDNSEDCLVMTGAGEMADVSCTSVFRYFCYKDSSKMSTNKCDTWDSDYKLDPRTGSCYKFHVVPRTWQRAAMACRAAQAHLAVINSDAESQALKELLSQHPPESLAGTDNHDMVHIGFWDWQEHGEWRTIFGETLADAGFESWRDTEPNNYLGKEFCGTMFRDGRLNDYPCDGKAASICEITPK